MNRDFFAREWGESRSRKRLIKQIEMRGGAALDHSVHRSVPSQCPA